MRGESATPSQDDAPVGIQTVKQLLDLVEKRVGATD